MEVREVAVVAFVETCGVVVRESACPIPTDTALHCVYVWPAEDCAHTNGCALQMLRGREASLISTLRRVRL